MNEEMYRAMEMVKEFGTKCRVIRKPVWHSIEDRNNNRVMKYNHASTIHDVWYSDPDLTRFQRELENTVLKNALKINPKFPTNRKNADYMIGKLNLLMNRGPVSCDQQAHTDYKERIKT